MSFLLVSLLDGYTSGGFNLWRFTLDAATSGGFTFGGFKSRAYFVSVSLQAVSLMTCSLLIPAAALAHMEIIKQNNMNERTERSTISGAK